MTYKEKLQQECPWYINENGGEDAAAVQIHTVMKQKVIAWH